MIRFDFKTLLIAVLVIGGAFELTKRLSFKREASDLQEIGKFHKNQAANRNLRPLGHLPHQPSSERYAKARPFVSLSANNKLKFASASPLEGQYDSSRGNASGNKTTKPPTVAKDKKTAQNKKCRPKNNSQLSQNNTVNNPFKLQRLESKPGQSQLSPLSKDQSQNRLQSRSQAPSQTLAGNLKPQGPEKETEEEICEEEEPQKPNEKIAEDKFKKSDEDDSKNDAPNSGSTYVGSYGTGGIQPQTNQKHSEDALLESWKIKLLTAPNFKETVRFIEAVQKGEISTQVFYTVVEMMLTDPRQQIQELGVIAAGRTPSLDSYHLLVDVLKKERFGSALRQKVESELNTFEQVQFLWVLEKVILSSDDTFAVIWATKQVDDSAKKYLDAKYNRPVKGENGTLSNQNPFKSQYKKFIAALQSLSTGNSNSEQSLQARDTLKSLEDLLKNLS